MKKYNISKISIALLILLVISLSLNLFLYLSLDKKEADDNVDVLIPGHIQNGKEPLLGNYYYVVKNYYHHQESDTTFLIEVPVIVHLNRGVVEGIVNQTSFSDMTVYDNVVVTPLDENVIIKDEVVFSAVCPDKGDCDVLNSSIAFNFLKDGDLYEVNTTSLKIAFGEDQ